MNGWKTTLKLIILLCQFLVLNLSVNGYVLESVLGYNFEHNEQLVFGLLFIIALHRTDESQKGRNSCLRLKLLAWSELLLILVH